MTPHPHFMLFATQNPAGAYGGRKPLSRAFRSRFLELQVADIPDSELAEILTIRCRMAHSRAKCLVSAMHELQRRRQVRSAASFPYISCSSAWHDPCEVPLCGTLVVRLGGLGEDVCNQLLRVEARMGPGGPVRVWREGDDIVRKGTRRPSGARMHRM